MVNAKLMKKIISEYNRQVKESTMKGVNKMKSAEVEALFNKHFELDTGGKWYVPKKNKNKLTEGKTWTMDKWKELGTGFERKPKVVKEKKAPAPKKEKKAPAPKKEKKAPATKLIAGTPFLDKKFVGDIKEPAPKKTSKTYLKDKKTGKITKKEQPAPKIEEKDTKMIKKAKAMKVKQDKAEAKAKEKQDKADKKAKDKKEKEDKKKTKTITFEAKTPAPPHKVKFEAKKEKKKQPPSSAPAPKKEETNETYITEEAKVAMSVEDSIEGLNDSYQYYLEQYKGGKINEEENKLIFKYYTTNKKRIDKLKAPKPQSKLKKAKEEVNLLIENNKDNLVSIKYNKLSNFKNAYEAYIHSNNNTANHTISNKNNLKKMIKADINKFSNTKKIVEKEKKGDKSTEQLILDINSGKYLKEIKEKEKKKPPAKQKTEPAKEVLEKLSKVMSPIFDKNFNPKSIIDRVNNKKDIEKIVNEVNEIQEKVKALASKIGKTGDESQTDKLNILNNKWIKRKKSIQKSLRQADNML